LSTQLKSVSLLKPNSGVVKLTAIDAQVILAFAQSQQPENWRPDSESLQKLSELVSEAEALRATLRQWDNQAYTQAYILNLPKVVRKGHKCFAKSY
jgi:hypothetical protein